MNGVIGRNFRGNQQKDVQDSEDPKARKRPRDRPKSASHYSAEALADEQRSGDKSEGEKDPGGPNIPSVAKCPKVEPSGPGAIWRGPRKI